MLVDIGIHRYPRRLVPQKRRRCQLLQLQKLDHVKLLSVPDVAKQLGLTEPTIRSWLMHRRLGFVRLGRRVLIPSIEVDRLVERGFVPAVPERTR